MGHLQHNLCQLEPARRRRLRPRPCLRHGCGRVYRPRRWNQRYCQVPPCPMLVRRWQATKRQQQCRSRPEGRQAHAAAEQKRRARRRAEGCASQKADSPRDRDLGRRRETSSAASTKRERPKGTFGPDRRTKSCGPAVSTPQDFSPEDGNSGHRSEGSRSVASIGTYRSEKDCDPDRRAWSRSKRIPVPFCDRPGCYEGVRPSSRCQARYCSDECRQAVKRVHDRERKWMTRNTEAGRYKRSLEYEAARRARRAASTQAETQGNSPAAPQHSPVVNYRPFPRIRVSCRDPKEGPADDREKNPGRGPRAPPSE